MGESTWRGSLGAVGEAAVKRELERRGWVVRDLNQSRLNEPNADLEVRKGGRLLHLQVKTSNLYGWISAGGVNEAICAGASPFNKAKNAQFQCQFLVCLTPSSKGDKKVVVDNWRYFVMPVDVADRLFRINIDGYFNTPKKDGSQKVNTGACRDWIGPGACPSHLIPDHSGDYSHYEGNFQILDNAPMLAHRR